FVTRAVAVRAGGPLRPVLHWAAPSGRGRASRSARALAGLAPGPGFPGRWPHRAAAAAPGPCPFAPALAWPRSGLGVADPVLAGPVWGGPAFSGVRPHRPDAAWPRQGCVALADLSSLPGPLLSPFAGRSRSAGGAARPAAAALAVSAAPDSAIGPRA